MKKIFKKGSILLMTIAGVFAISSCSNESGPFGKLTGVVEDYESKLERLDEKMETASFDDYDKLSEEKAELQEEWAKKIEEAAKTLDGTELAVENGEFTVVSPLTLEFATMSGCRPVFNIKGEAKATETIRDVKLSGFNPKAAVMLQGLNDKDEVAFSFEVGTVAFEYQGTEVVVLANTPVVFTGLEFRVNNRNLNDVKVMKLVLK